MSSDILKFVLSFIGGMLFYRILFFITPIYFKKPFTRSILKLRWHHWHWGIVLVFIGTLLLLVSGKTTTVIVLFGIGLGLIIDLFIPSLQLETDREKELEVYRDSLVATLILGALITIFSIFLSILTSHY